MAGKVKLTCFHCEKEFEQYPSRARNRKYPCCSRECFNAAKAGRRLPLRRPMVKLKCAWCELEFERQECIYRDQQKRGMKATYCSKDCASKGKTRDNLVVNFESGRRSNIRTQMIRCGMLKECERCGYKKNTNILQVHHKDRNKTNNDPSNLEIICPNCHAEEHWGEGQERFRGRG